MKISGGAGAAPTEVNRARRPGTVRDLLEFVGPLDEGLTEDGGVPLEFPDNQHTHDSAPSEECRGPDGFWRLSSGVRRGQRRRITCDGCFSGER
jgi:hypothetical protein